MTDRLPCCVPYCRRTTAADRIAPNNEWICQIHWRLVPATVKRRKRLADRIWDRANATFLRLYEEQGCCFHEHQYRRALAARDVRSAAWQRCKRQAIERAAGI
jgi:hypothetical protein